MSTRTKRTT